MRKDHALEQAVGGEAVGPVQASARHLPAQVQPRDGRRPVQVDASSGWGGRGRGVRRGPGDRFRFLRWP